MRHDLIKAVALLILIFTTGFSACSTNSKDSKDDSKQLAEMAELLNVEFPADTRIVFSEKNDRDKEAAYFYIIYTPTPVKFNISPRFKKPAEDTRESLKRVVKNINLGKIKDKWAYCYEGEMKNGSWKIYQTNFETGSFLDVQQFFF